MHTVKALTTFILHHQSYTYFIIFIGLILEGEFTLIATGILAHLGALNIVFALIYIISGSLCKTFLGYSLGRYIHRRWGENKFVQYIEKKVFNIMPHFEKKPFWSIFLSKFIIGVNNAVLIFSGYKKIEMKKYLKAEIFAISIWAPLMLSLGYLFSYTALNISREIWRFSLVIVLLVVSFILIDKLLAFIYEIFEEFYDKN